MLITVLSILILIFSAIIHEYAHGYMAYKLGDNTAKFMGRLTLNPLSHVEVFGSIILPITMILSGMNFVLGWAKPVPYNPNNLDDQKFGDSKVALAGPASNFFLAVIFGLIIRFIPISIDTKTSLIIMYLSGQNLELLQVMHGFFLGSLLLVSAIICLTNIFLGIFNLIPIPPLDGSKIITVFLNRELRDKWLSYEKYGMIILIILLSINFFNFLQPTALFLFSLFSGI